MIRYYFLFIPILCSVVSCEKMLDVKPIDFLSEEAFFRTEAQLESGVAAVYDILSFYGGTQHQTYGLHGDEGYGRGAGVGVRANDFTSGDAVVQAFWTTFYSGISRANVLLVNVDNNPDINQAFRDRIRGEALFLRAFYYFMLVQTYGGVPLILEPVTSALHTDFPRASTEETYQQILADMKQAEELVPAISELGFGGRISKSAVRGMLARVCLHMAGYPLRDVSKYAEARDWAKKVMDDTEADHALNPDFTQVFINYAQDLYDIKESIWEVEFWGNRTDAYLESNWIGYVNGPPSSNPLTGLGFGGVQITAQLYYSYEEEDLRRDWSIADFTYNATGPAGAKTPITTTTLASIYTRYAAKWRREFEVLAKNGANTPQNFPLLRYSDVLLMFAEAENEVNNGPTAAAYDAINMVRRRGFGKLLPDATNIDDHDLSGLDYGTFKEEIMGERRRELCFELLRKYDMIRWGTYVQTMNEIGSYIATNVNATIYYGIFFRNVLPKQVIWPIPIRELTLNKALVQNEDW